MQRIARTAGGRFLIMTWSFTWQREQDIKIVTFSYLSIFFIYITVKRWVRRSPARYFQRIRCTLSLFFSCLTPYRFPTWRLSSVLKSIRILKARPLAKRLNTWPTIILTSSSLTFRVFFPSRSSDKKIHWRTNTKTSLRYSWYCLNV